MPSESGLESALGGRLDLEAVNHCVEQTINEIRVNRVNCSSVEYSAMAAFLDGARGKLLVLFVWISSERLLKGW